MLSNNKVSATQLCSRNLPFVMSQKVTDVSSQVTQFPNCSRYTTKHHLYKALQASIIFFAGFSLGDDYSHKFALSLR